MNVELFFRTFIIGISIAAAVGPMSLLCIQRTLTRGYLYGLISGLGIASADGLYASVSAFGLTAISNVLISQNWWVHLVGGIFLIYLGCRTALTPPAQKAARTVTVRDLPHAYGTTLVLTLTNPMTIISFALIFASVGLGNTSGTVPALGVTLSIFLGSLCWWLVLVSGVSLLRERLTTTWLLWINRLSGGGIVLFGLLILFKV
ncbi:LysE family translocator [Ktedonospora formicarum]|uniref:Lysine transporter LysE n=1 Tax=Ktedonospora formicarum TaxID=2778364 RepID=A0A8J3I4V0_9CHLR|nr:LysE family transporter [Ktedonospora formicarum]GHO46680.1 lysine transporter LysE [Ktedonospora formicarum]